MYRSPLLDSACPVCKRGKNVYDYDYVLRPAETLAFTNDTFYKRLQLRFDYGWTNRKSRTLLAAVLRLAEFSGRDRRMRAGTHHSILLYELPDSIKKSKTRQGNTVEWFI